MILDNLHNSDNYSSLHPLFKQAFDYLKSFDPDKIKEGKHDIVGDKLFALVSLHDNYEANNKLEAHRSYIDIQYIHHGTDAIGWRELDTCKETLMTFDEAKDVALFTDAPDFKFNLAAGCFTILYPQDAHAPLMGNEKLVRVVLKVKI
jgi:YhcH/YjgK/YiaL family protein